MAPNLPSQRLTVTPKDYEDFLPTNFPSVSLSPAGLPGHFFWRAGCAIRRHAHGSQTALRLGLIGGRVIRHLYRLSDRAANLFVDFLNSSGLRTAGGELMGLLDSS